MRVAEEIVLLLLDDESGDFVPAPIWSVRFALAGAVLMDLALENRIDTDLDKLFTVDTTPLGDNLLDPTLVRIAESPKTHDARYWIENTAEYADEIREEALARLVERGVLRREDNRFLWVFKSRRYPIIDGKAEREVKLRLMEVLFSDEIPDPRDIVIICLADACDLFTELLSKRELERAAKRVEQVRRMDLIGQAMSKVVWEHIQASIALAARPYF